MNPKPQASLRRGALAGGILAAAVWTSSLVTPHAVYPEELPDPALDDELAVSVERDQVDPAEVPLPYSVRVIGELVRRCGRAEYQGDAAAYQVARAELQQAVHKVSELKAIVALRALQTQLFLQAFLSLEAQRRNNSVAPNGVTAALQLDNDLVELGGSFVRHHSVAAMPDADASTVERQELAAAYRLRWTELVGTVPGFSSSRRDRVLSLKWRLRRAARLSVPDRGRAELAVLSEIRAVDPDYPLAYAQGIALLHAGATEHALSAFQSYLEANPSGAYTFRARNFALYSALELQGN